MRYPQALEAEGPDPLDVLEHLLRTLDLQPMDSEAEPFRTLVKRFAREAAARGFSLSEAEAEVRKRMGAVSGRIPERKQQWLTERLIRTCRVWYR